MTDAERQAVRLVIEALRMTVAAQYRESESGKTLNVAMQKLDDAAKLLKQGDQT